MLRICFNYNATSSCILFFLEKSEHTEYYISKFLSEFLKLEIKKFFKCSFQLKMHFTEEAF